MTWCHVYDWVYELKQQTDLKSLTGVSLLKDTKPKTHTDFGYTMKALFWSRIWLDVMCMIEYKNLNRNLSSVSLLEDAKQKTHTEFSYTIKALRSKKKLG